MEAPIKLKIKWLWWTFHLEVEEEPLANLIGNVVTDAIERHEAAESAEAIGFYTKGGK